jgi:hypothetical protein
MKKERCCYCGKELEVTNPILDGETWGIDWFEDKDGVYRQHYTCIPCFEEHEW